MGDVVDFLREGEPRAREEKYQNLLIFQSINFLLSEFVSPTESALLQSVVAFQGKKNLNMVRFPQK